MSIIFLSKTSAEMFKSRINQIQPDTNPKWGTLNAIKLLRHLRFSIELSLGKEIHEDQSNILSRTVLRYLFFHVLTNWPKGKFKAPDYFTPEPEHDFARERQDLFSAIDEFVIKSEQEPDQIAVSPFFGPMKLSYWQRIHGVHFNHHFKQFGV